jgi:integral membrane sensor domain MASE1
MNKSVSFGSTADPRPPASAVVPILVLALAYFASARLCLIFGFANTNVAPIWFPSGIALVAVWILGYRVWPGIFIGAFLANVIAFMEHQFGGLPMIVILSGVIALGNASEAVAGCYVLKRITQNTHPLASTDDVLKFLGVVLLTCLANSVFGPTALCLLGKVPWTYFSKMWLTWWLGDTAGILTLAPILLLFHQHKSIRWNKKRVVEAVVVLAILIVVNYEIFFGSALLGRSYFLIPLVVWTAYRFGVVGASIATLVTFGVAMAGTIVGMGPFANADLDVSLIMLSAFIGVVSLTGLILAAALKDRIWAIDKASKNEQRFRSLVEHSSDMISVVSPDAVILYASPSTKRLLGYDNDE